MQLHVHNINCNPVAPASLFGPKGINAATVKAGAVFSWRGYIVSYDQAQKAYFLEVDSPDRKQQPRFIQFSALACALGWIKDQPEKTRIATDYEKAMTGRDRMPADSVPYYE